MKDAEEPCTDQTATDNPGQRILQVFAHRHLNIQAEKSIS
jgi:hypothetical protein